MNKLFEKCFEELIGVEGGFVDDPTDRGGATRYGVTEKVARQNGYTGDMCVFPLSLAKSIYHINYWKIQGLDFVSKIDSRIAKEMFDTGVNMGVRTSVIFLQRAINSMRLEVFEITEDGLFGDKTLVALNDVCHDQLGKDTVLKLLNIQQGKRYLEIVRKIPEQRRFIRGWIKRVSFKC